MSRYKAFAIHLCISACIGALVFLAIVCLWYPPPLFDADGGSTLTLLLIGVDLALGPLLTLVVFRSGKPSLRFDLSVIALLQASALAYGVWISAQSRPVYLALLPNRARIVHANQLVDVPASGPFSSAPWLGPKPVVARLPEDSARRNEILWSVISGAPDIDYRASRYVALADIPDLASYGTGFEQLASALPDKGAAMRAWLEARSTALPGTFRMLPLLTRGRELLVVFDPNSRRIIGITSPSLAAKQSRSPWGI